MKKLAFLLVIVAFLGFVSAQLDIIGESDEGVINLMPDTPQTFANATLNQTYFDAKYWKLDGSNAPPSSSWDMGGYNLNNSGIEVFGGSNNASFEEFSLVNGRFVITNTGTGSLGLRIRNLEVGTPVLQLQGASGTGAIGYWSANDIFQFNVGQSLLDANGSMLTDVCLTNGTGCQTFNMSQFNVTNIAYTNKSNAFTELNTFEDGIDITGATGTINFTTAGVNCIHWEQGIADTSICSDSNIIDISAVNTRFPKSLKLVLGEDGVTGPTNKYGLQAYSSGNDDFFYFTPNNAEWGITYPIGWGLRDGDSGLLFDWANTRQKYNITWNNWNCIISNDCNFKINTRGDLRLNNDLGYAGNVTTNTDFCLSDGTCLGTAGNSTIDGHTTSWFSATTTTNSSLLGDLFPFAKTNYTTYRNINNSVSGITYEANSGGFTVANTGSYKISVDYFPDWHGSSEQAINKILINDVIKYASYMEVTTDEAVTVQIILDLSANDVIEFLLDDTSGGCAGGCGNQVNYGTTINIHQVG